MTPSAPPTRETSTPPVGVAFQLAQLGAHATEQFARSLSEIGLTPPLAGVLRLLTAEPGLSQQQLAERLGTVPSRIVGYVDDLEARGWISRERDAVDRRVNVLTLTPAGRRGLSSIGAVSRRHEKRITAGLDEDERRTLLALLGKVVAAQNLIGGVHPGYRTGVSSAAAEGSAVRG